MDYLPNELISKMYLHRPSPKYLNELKDQMEYTTEWICKEFGLYDDDYDTTNYENSVFTSIELYDVYVQEMIPQHTYTYCKNCRILDLTDYDDISDHYYCADYKDNYNICLDKMRKRHYDKVLVDIKKPFQFKRYACLCANYVKCPLWLYILVLVCAKIDFFFKLFIKDLNDSY
jgi:hypothetical protein